MSEKKKIVLQKKKKEKIRFNGQKDFEKTDKEKEHEKGLTNKILSEDIPKTKAMWKEQGYVEINPETLLMLPLRTFVKYITKRNQARNGGLLLKVNTDPDYVIFFNPNNRISWSCQIQNLRSAYIKEDLESSEQESSEQESSESESEDESSQSED